MLVAATPDITISPCPDCGSLIHDVDCRRVRLSRALNNLAVATEAAIELLDNEDTASADDAIAIVNDVLTQFSEV